jgi:hypothetical protein
MVWPKLRRTVPGRHHCAAMCCAGAGHERRACPGGGVQDPGGDPRRRRFRAVVHTLFGSIESFGDAENWVAGVRIGTATASSAPNPRPTPRTSRSEITVDLPRPSPSSESAVVAHHYHYHARSSSAGGPAGAGANTLPGSGQVGSQVSSNVINSLARTNASIVLPRSEILPESANFAGTVLVFSWPSAASLVKYDEDRESAEFAVPHLAQTFRLLTDEIGKKNVYIVAHSMGNQVLVNALLQSALSKANLTITELVMAAPDVDKDVFGTKVDQIRTVAKNITLYASAADKALLASGEKSFGTRLGYVGANGPNVFAGIDVIDVTAVGDDMLGLDHGTFSSSRAVLDDLGRLIRSLTHLPPDVRTPTLRFMPDKAHVEYWLYPP